MSKISIIISQLIVTNALTRKRLGGVVQLTKKQVYLAGDETRVTIEMASSLIHRGLW